MLRFSSYRDFDWTLLGLVGALSVLSVMEIHSVTKPIPKFHGYDHRQIEFLLVGLVLMFVISRIDYHQLLNITPWAYGLSILSLVAVITPHIGQKVQGARRWISLGGIHFQPSEGVKLVLILTMAHYFAGMQFRGMTWPNIVKASALIGVPMLLVKMEPDLGTALTYFPLLVCGLFFCGIRFKQVAILLLGFVLVGGIALKSGKHLKGYQQKRIEAFMNPDSDLRGKNYQVEQSKIAVGDGGIFGKGVDKGSQTQGDFLPFPHTDFIFASFSEEHGFVGSMFILVIYFLIMMRLIQNAQTAPDSQGSLIVMGVVAVLLFQIAVNIGMAIGMLPVTGIPLPLMSYGGSTVLFTFLSLGIVMNIRMRRFVN